MLAEMTIIGRIGRDAELRYTPAGTAIASFSIATNKKKKDANGLVQDYTTWFRVSAWGQLGEFANEHCKKGALVAVQGELDADPASGCPRMFTRKDGTQGTSYEVTASKLRMLVYANNENDEQDEIPF